MVVSRLAGPGQLSDTSHAEGGSLSRAHVSSRQPFLPKCLDERVMRRCIAQNLSRVIVHPTLNPQDLVFAHVADWAALGDETANQLVLVFARPALPGSIGVAEVDVCHILQGIVQSRELRAVVRVTVLNSWPKYAPARSLSCRTAWLTDSASFPASFRMTSKRVCRSTNVSSTASDLVLFPTTVSTSQWPKVFRVPTASGRSSMDFPSTRLFGRLP